jgi:hypothetical protein
MPPFIEQMAGKGLKMLKEAAKEKGLAAGRLKEALKFRLAAAIMLETAANAPAKAAAALEKRYPFGVNGEHWRGYIRCAGTAMRKLTILPRLAGLGVGAILAGLLYALYYFGPLKRALFHSTGSPASFDILILMAGFALSVLPPQIAVTRILIRTLGRFQEGEKKRLSPKWNTSLLMGGPAALLLYATIVQLAVMTGHNAPAWYVLLLNP